MSERSFYKSIEEGALVLTPNQRLSAHLKKNYACKLTKTQSVIVTPKIFPLSVWVQRCINQLEDLSLFKPILLKPQQSLLLWQKIVNEHQDVYPLLEVSQTAKALAKSYGLLKSWALPLSSLETFYDDDSKAFLALAQAYERSLTDNNWTDTHGAFELVVDAFKSSLLKTPTDMFLVAMDNITPQEQKLFELLESLGTNIKHHDSEQKNSLSCKAGFDTQYDEISAMLQNALGAHEKGTASIACVIPNLNQLRNSIIRTIDELYPNNNNEPLFNISGGKPLNEYPVLYSAFLALKLLEDRIPVNALSQLLRSPFLGDADIEQFKRAQVDIIIRDIGNNTVTIDNIIQIHDELALSNQVPLFIKRLENIILFKQKLKTKPQSTRVWAKTFYEALTILGWPGERIVDSPEYQSIKRFLELLKDFSELELTGIALNLNTAIESLTEMAKDILFQIQSKDAPIQVLGLLEASGLPFDTIWVMGMTDEAWPTPTKPDPFIPIALQRQFNMPHSSANRELTFCQKVTKRFSQSAEFIIFSYSKHDEDKELNASSLIQDFKERPDTESLVPGKTSIANDIFASSSLETILDDKAPPILDDEKISGGSYLLKLQNACPFRAFSEIRLGIEMINGSETGISALERGLLIHSTLEHIWQELTCHKTLCSKTEAFLDKLISKSIDKGVEDAFDAIRAENLTQSITIEKERTHALIKRWLELEKQRPPFKVKAIEKWHHAKINGLSLRLRVDRIDELADGGQLIIDYKSGKTHISQVFGERLDEPQLPLYCLTSASNLAGLTFAQVNTKEIKFNGISDFETDIDGVTPIEECRYNTDDVKWDEMMDSWQRDLTDTASSFMAGDIRINPKYNTSCQYCVCAEICRINEQL